MWERVEETNSFLQILNAPRVAWVNPMPRNRWLNTSAEVIAQSMEMFTCEALELRNAVKLLRGKLK